LDKLNGDLKFSTITSDACKINSNFLTSKAISLLGYAAKNHIVSQEKIMKEINEQGGGIKSIYHEVKFRCDAHKARELKATQEQQKETEKQNEIKIDRDRGISL
jgi:hypothetical protein